MNAALNHRISVAITKPHDTQHKCGHGEEKPNDRKATENPKVVGDQRFRILVRNNAAGGIAFVTIVNGPRPAGCGRFVRVRPQIRTAL